MEFEQSASGVASSTQPIHLPHTTRRRKGAGVCLDGLLVVHQDQVRHSFPQNTKSFLLELLLWCVKDTVTPDAFAHTYCFRPLRVIHPPLFLSISRNHMDPLSVHLRKMLNLVYGTSSLGQKLAGYGDILEE